MSSARSRRAGFGILVAGAAVLWTCTAAIAVVDPFSAAPHAADEHVAVSVRRLDDKMTAQIQALDKRSRQQDAEFARLGEERAVVLETLDRLHGRIDELARVLDETVLRLKLAVAAVVILCAIVFAWIIAVYRRVSGALGVAQTDESSFSRQAPPATALAPRSPTIGGD